MHDSLSRRQILTAKLRPLPGVLRPPWAVKGFEAKCDACGDCIKACPQKILRADGGGLPVIDFSRTGCDFCAECAKSCQSGAIRQSGTPWSLDVRVLGRCLAVQGTVCRSCEENCEEAAIRFRLGLNGKSYPLIDADECNGCGFCFAPCPTGAIAIEVKHMEEAQA